MALDPATHGHGHIAWSPPPPSLSQARRQAAEWVQVRWDRRVLVCVVWFLPPATARARNLASRSHALHNQRVPRVHLFVLQEANPPTRRPTPLDSPRYDDLRLGCACCGKSKGTVALRLVGEPTTTASDDSGGVGRGGKGEGLVSLSKSKNLGRTEPPSIAYTLIRRPDRGSGRDRRVSGAGRECGADGYPEMLSLFSG
jgi:hypothetical protein